jgi:cell division protein FtsB
MIYPLYFQFQSNIKTGFLFGGQTTVRDATRREIDELKRENNELKQLVADLSLDVYRLKKTAVPPLENGDDA